MNIRIPRERPSHSDLGRTQVFTLLKRSDFLTSLLVILSLILLVTSFAPFALLAALTASLLIVALRRDLGRKLRRILLAFSTVLLILLTMPSAIYARTITVTLTHTEYRTTTTTLWQDTTITPTITITRGTGSTTTIFLPTTTYVTRGKAALEIKIRILTQDCSTEITPPLKGYTYCLRIELRNMGGIDLHVSPTTELRFNGDPKQIVGSGDTTWSLDAEPDASTKQFPTTTVKAGSSDYVDRSMVLKWNWIPPASREDVARSLLQKSILKVFDAILRKVGLRGFLDAIAGIQNLHDLYEIGEHAVLFANYRYAVSARLQETGGAQDQSHDFISRVPDEALEAFSNAIRNGIIGVAVAIAAIILSFIIGGGIAGFMTWAASTVIGWTMWATGRSAYDAATDPDPRYQQGTPVQVKVPPMVQSMPEGVEKRLALSSLRYEAYFRAHSESMAKHYGAIEAGDIKTARSQLDSAKSFLDQAKSHFNEVQRDYSAIASKLPTLDQESINRVKTSLAKGELPEQLRQLLSELGDAYFQDNIIGIANGAPQAVQSISVNDGLNGVAKSLDTQSQALSTKSQSLEKTSQEAQGPFMLVFVATISGAVSILAVVVFMRRPRIAARPGTGRRAYQAPPRPERALQSCPICHHMVRYDSHGGKWYCSHCHRIIG